ncbi:MAG: methyltransferase [Thaumarchaeota archaeon]|nr:methyltransferase [Nitrososphaerota archaeon]
MLKKLPNDYYKPDEDTFFIADYIQNETGRSALDVGTGSGFLASVLSGKFEFVVCTDVSIAALKKAHESVSNCICCNSADAINYDFDLAVCNLPYLPSDGIDDAAVDGLEEGLGVPTEIIKSAGRTVRKGGKFIFLTSSLANHEELIRRTESLGFSSRIVAKKKLFFEELLLVESLKL